MVFLIESSSTKLRFLLPLQWLIISIGTFYAWGLARALLLIAFLPICLYTHVRIYDTLQEIACMHPLRFLHSALNHERSILIASFQQRQEELKVKVQSIVKKLDASSVLDKKGCYESREQSNLIHHVPIEKKITK